MSWFQGGLKMMKIFQVSVAMLSILSFTAMETVSSVATGSVSIGTVSARGDFRLDSHVVRGNATLFNGSVVETGVATADLRVGKSAAITMSTNSRGTLYSDRLVLQQGESELTRVNSGQSRRRPAARSSPRVCWRGITARARPSSCMRGSAPAPPSAARRPRRGSSSPGPGA